MQLNTEIKLKQSKLNPSLHIDRAKFGANSTHNDNFRGFQYAHFLKLFLSRGLDHPDGVTKTHNPQVNRQF